jgi:hypothetical protein
MFRILLRYEPDEEDEETLGQSSISSFALESAHVLNL